MAFQNTAATNSDKPDLKLQDKLNQKINDYSLKDIRVDKTCPVEFCDVVIL